MTQVILIDLVVTAIACRYLQDADRYRRRLNRRVRPYSRYRHTRQKEA